MVLKEEEPSDSLSDGSVLADPKGFEPLTFWSVVALGALIFSIFVHYILISSANLAMILAIRSYPLLSFDEAVHEKCTK